MGKKLITGAFRSGFIDGICLLRKGGGEKYIKRWLHQNVNDTETLRFKI